MHDEPCTSVNRSAMRSTRIDTQLRKHVEAPGRCKVKAVEGELQPMQAGLACGHGTTEHRWAHFPSCNDRDITKAAARCPPLEVAARKGDAGSALIWSCQWMHSFDEGLLVLPKR